MSSIKPRTFSIVIYQGDDLERLSDLRRAAEHAERVAAEAKKSSSGRMGDGEPEKDKAAEDAKAAFDAFVEEAAERATTVAGRAIGRKAFAELLAEHPPRETKGENGTVTHEDDELYEVDMRTFPDALLTYRSEGVQCITEPEFGSKAELQAFLDNDLSYGDYERLFATAFGINKALGADPKEARYSTGTPSSDIT